MNSLGDLLLSRPPDNDGIALARWDGMIRESLSTAPLLRLSDPEAVELDGPFAKNHRLIRLKSVSTSQLQKAVAEEDAAGAPSQCFFTLADLAPYLVKEGMGAQIFLPNSNDDNSLEISCGDLVQYLLTKSFSKPIDVIPWLSEDSADFEKLIIYEDIPTQIMPEEFSAFLRKFLPECLESFNGPCIGESPDHRFCFLFFGPDALFTQPSDKHEAILDSIRWYFPSSASVLFLRQSLLETQTQTPMTP